MESIRDSHLAKNHRNTSPSMLSNIKIHSIYKWGNIEKHGCPTGTQRRRIFGVPTKVYHTTGDIDFRQRRQRAQSASGNAKKRSVMYKTCPRRSGEQSCYKTPKAPPNTTEDETGCSTTHSTEQLCFGALIALSVTRTFPLPPTIRRQHPPLVRHALMENAGSRWEQRNRRGRIVRHHIALNEGGKPMTTRLQRDGV